jgi:excisionase family DNA binding protein
LEDSVNRKELRSLILRRMDELDRWYGSEYPDPDKIVATEGAIVYEVANKMARAGFAELHAAGLTLRAGENQEVVKTYLSRCLRALRPKRRGGSKSADVLSDCLTVVQAAALAGVGKRTIYKLCEDGRLPHHRVGTGRGTIRIKRRDLDRYLEQNRVEGCSPVQEKDYLFS